MEPKSTASNLPYSVKVESPFTETVLYTRPMIPNGAHWMIQVTVFERAAEISFKDCLVVSDALRRAIPIRTAHTRIPI